MEEIWKTVIGASNYEISNLGRVKNKKTEKILKNQIIKSQKSKTYVVYINRFLKKSVSYVGLLVAEHFIGKIENKPFLWYKDCNIKNNRVNNLYWSEYKQDYCNPNILINATGRSCTKCQKSFSWGEFDNGYSKSVKGKSNICCSCYLEYRDTNRELFIKRARDNYRENKDHYLELNRKYKSRPAKYKFFVGKLTPIEDPKESSKGKLMVKCAKCRKYFIPTTEQAYNRLMSLNGNSLGENRLYCSQICKVECSVYRRISKPMGFDLNKYRDARTIEWDKIVFERDHCICQECGSKNNLVAHHIVPVAEEFIQSADIDNGITLCKSCHKNKHKEISGCGYQELGSLCK